MVHNIFPKPRSISCLGNIACSAYTSCVSGSEPIWFSILRGNISKHLYCSYRSVPYTPNSFAPLFTWGLRFGSLLYQKNPKEVRHKYENACKSYCVAADFNSTLKRKQKAEPTPWVSLKASTLNSQKHAWRSGSLLGLWLVGL